MKYIIVMLSFYFLRREKMEKETKNDLDDLELENLDES